MLSIITLSYSADIFIESCNKGYMTRTRLSGDTGVRDSPYSLRLYNISGEIPSC